MIAMKKLNYLKDSVFNNKNIESCDSALQTVFLSICNIKDRARVFHGSGVTLANAWENAVYKVNNFLKTQMLLKKPYFVKWIKADVVVDAETISSNDLTRKIVNYQWKNFARLGISFDEKFKVAFIEAEIHGNKMLDFDFTQAEIMSKQVDYNKNMINLANINHYLKTYYKLSAISSIPENLTIFITQGFFIDEEDTIHELYHDNMDFGRRRVDLIDEHVIHHAIVGASEYLVRLINEKGRFIYGYFPIFGATMVNYNIVRHTSTLWSVINLYRLSNDDTLIPKIDTAIEFMLNEIVYVHDCAYLVEASSGEIKLGALGVSIIMLTEYMDVFKTDKYNTLVTKLANGILTMHNNETGAYIHVLNANDYTIRDAFRTVYYEGEATFGLARAYTYTGEQKFLDAAITSVEMFIRENYIIHRDHWVAYALNEVTKYVDDVRYFEFALMNIDKNLKGIYKRATSFHTYLEMLMTGWQTYRRAFANNIDSEMIKAYDPTFFAQTM